MSKSPVKIKKKKPPMSPLEILVLWLVFTLAAEAIPLLLLLLTHLAKEGVPSSFHAVYGFHKFLLLGFSIMLATLGDVLIEALRSKPVAPGLFAGATILPCAAAALLGFAKCVESINPNPGTPKDQAWIWGRSWLRYYCWCSRPGPSPGSLWRMKNGEVRQHGTDQPREFNRH